MTAELAAVAVKFCGCRPPSPGLAAWLALFIQTLRGNKRHGGQIRPALSAVEANFGRWLEADLHDSGNTGGLAQQLGQYH